MAGYLKVFIPTHAMKLHGWGTRSAVPGRGSRFARMPTLATIKQSRRWGTRSLNGLGGGGFWCDFLDSGKGGVGLGVLCGAGEVEVLFHGAAGAGGVVGADGAVDLAVHLG